MRRLLGLKRLSDLATNSRILSAMEATGVAHLRHFLTALVVERIQEMDLRRIALDFDGSVTCTGFLAEATAVGFNPKKKGQRRYQPGNQIIVLIQQVKKFSGAWRLRTLWPTWTIGKVFA